jgi:hypothetical protein
MGAGAMSQATDALARGNTIRLGMAAKRRELAALPRAEARRLAADWIEDPDEIVGRMRIGYLLESITQVGSAMAISYLRACGLDAGAINRRVLLLKHNNRPVRSRPDSALRPLSLPSRSALVDLLRSEADRIERGR